MTNVIDSNCVKQVFNASQVIRQWPTVLQIAAQDRVVSSIEELLKMFLCCLETGVVLFVLEKNETVGFCCASSNGQAMMVHALPADSGKGYAKACMGKLYEHAVERGLQEILIASRLFNGSSFRYFEKSLGFQRKLTIFSMKVCQTHQHK